MQMSQYERNITAKAIRSIRSCLRYHQDKQTGRPLRIIFYIMVLITMVLLAKGCEQPGWAFEPVKGHITQIKYHLKASWYSRQSLIHEGTWKNGKERKMANGHKFSDSGYTCASRLFPLGAVVRVENSLSKRQVYVRVTDRIGKRFAKTRIDLSPASFERIGKLQQGLINVTVERIS